MKRILLLPVLALAMAFGASAQKNATPDGAKRQFQVFGVAFYNLENLFDTINNNGKYDAEFSPDGARQWPQILVENFQPRPRHHGFQHTYHPQRAGIYRRI